jgi:hypothetical protein
MEAETLVRVWKSDKLKRSSLPETSVKSIDWAIEIDSDRVADRKLGNSPPEKGTSMLYALCPMATDTLFT